MNNIIELSKLKKTYRDKEVVNINGLFIEKNSIYGLIGPNGAGKSTTMKMICGLVNPTEGLVKVNGINMNDKNRISILKNIGSLIESPSNYPNLTGYENLKIIKDYKGFKNSDIDEALNIVGLYENKDKKVKEYSLGMKQRLGIAMALIGLPKILILDEPTNGLDPQAMEEIRELIRSLPNKYDTTVMISSHNLDEIEKMASKIGIIGNGKILYQGSIKDFKKNYSNDINIITSDNNKALLLLKDYEVKQYDNVVVLEALNDLQVANIVNVLVSNNINIYRVFESEKSLEKLFLEFTKENHL